MNTRAASANVSASGAAVSGYQLRLALKVLATAAASAALLIGTAFASAALFLLLNKADPRQARWDSMPHYWQLYADDPVLRKKLVAALVLSGVGGLVVLPAALVSTRRMLRRLTLLAALLRSVATYTAGESSSALVTPSLSGTPLPLG